MTAARKDRSDWMTRKVASGDEDGSFDREFWARQTVEQRLEAAWQCVLDYAAMKVMSERELRLQRSVVRVQRG